MECVECGVEADERAEGWRAYRADEPYTDEPPELAFYYPLCAEREFGPLWMTDTEVDELT